MNPRQVKISKFLSLVLRHDPSAAGITLDEAGWVTIDDLLFACHRRGFLFTRTELDEVVTANDKQRFAFSEDGTRIRASQGHSVTVELGYEAGEPPSVLFHGTARTNLESIKARGILKGRRIHVHLSLDWATATNVGKRHGIPVVLEVAADRMHCDGFSFFRSENGVWLTEHVPASYIKWSGSEVGG